MSLPTDVLNNSGPVHLGHRRTSIEGGSVCPTLGVSKNLHPRRQTESLKPYGNLEMLKKTV